MNRHNFENQGIQENKIVLLEDCLRIIFSAGFQESSPKSALFLTDFKDVPDDKSLKTQ